MKLAVRSRHVWLAAFLFVVFWISATYIPNRLILLITNSLVLSSSTAVGIAYMPVAWRAIRSAQEQKIQRILLGIAYSWLFGALWRIWTLLWLTSGQQSWMVNNDIIAFFQAGVFLGACYHLTSPGAIGGDFGEKVPSLKWIAVGIVAGIAVGLAGLLAYYNPDTTAFVNALKPYVPD